jgi:hypothetical protein
MASLSGGCRLPGSSCKSTWPLLRFARPVLKHSINSTRKKWLLIVPVGRMCERAMHVVEIACIFTDCSTATNQQNKFALNQRMLAERLL